MKEKEVTWNWQHHLSISDVGKTGEEGYTAYGAGRLPPENTETEDGQGQALEEKQQ